MTETWEAALRTEAAIKEYAKQTAEMHCVKPEVSDDPQSFAEWLNNKDKEFEDKDVGLFSHWSRDD